MQHQMNIAIEQYPSYFAPDQLFDLEKDPEEMNNLAEDPEYADVLAEMKERLRAYTETFDHPFDVDGGEFLRTEDFERLADETRKIGTDYIAWWPKPEWKF